MKKKMPIAMISVLVNDQDEALQFYVGKLGLEKHTDITYGPGMRLVTVIPRGQRKPEIALATPDPTRFSSAYIEELRARTGNGVAWMFDTDNCRESYQTLRERGVVFITTPTKQLYGIEAVFMDPYGNVFSLLEPAPEARSLFLERRVGKAA